MKKSFSRNVKKIFIYLVTLYYISKKVLQLSILHYKLIFNLRM